MPTTYFDTVNGQIILESVDGVQKVYIPDA